MKQPLIAVCVLLTYLLVGCQNRAIIGVIYQPQNRDVSVSDERWHQLFEDLRASGISEITLQWRHYDDQTFGGHDGWLADVVDKALSAGLKVRIGLFWDSAYFDRMMHSPDLLYLEQLVELNIAMLSTLENEHTEYHGILGWYLPLEISDRFGIDPKTRQTITAILAEAMAMVKSQRSIAISVYFTGAMPPSTFRLWVEELQATGLQIWVQDGRGAMLSPPSIIDLYLRELDCDVAIILERFRRTSPLNEDFRARITTQGEWQEQTRTLGCHPGHIFSLRYHPAARGILEH